MMMVAAYTEQRGYMMQVVVHIEARGNMMKEDMGDMMMMGVVPTQVLTSRTE